MIKLFGTTTAKDKRRETARRLLAFAVFQAWGWADLPTTEKGEKGKPFFPDHPNRCFNLSHTDSLVLCVLSDEGEVGVDIETIRPRKESLPRYVLSEAELTAFDGSWEDFFRLWTLKEAYAKYLGGSIFPPSAVPVPPPVPHRSYAGNGWRAALCGNGTLPERIEWVPLL